MAETEGTMEIEIPMEEGEPLGATPNDKLIITKVQNGTIAEGKLKIGDQIIKVNGQPISDQNNFFKALRFAPPVARLTIIRDQKKAEELEARVRIPEARAKLIQRRDGYAYFLAKLVWQPNGPKLGLGIKHFQNRVLVSRCDPGSLSSTQLAVGDHIIDIDGVPVTDKDVARDLLIKALQEKKEVSAVVERPETMEAKHWTQQALVTQVCQPPSVQMNSDVRAIAARERARVKEPRPPPKSILRQTQNTKSIQISDEVFSHIIASDNEGRALRPVRK
ncbi:PDZ/DHR/GLGF domain protein [Ancylostoma caninum]|uniref:PDZ/DHR/GLGF domain protein n=2 Tax=Ancylostoma caninum TaxID=29170 RepID=A0A368FJJ1_ANCCA|nr:PDZ/DHR/GLGF domain protein [Ancylostoma caninum]